MKINYKNLRDIGLYKNEHVEDFRLNKIKTIMIFAFIVWDSHICIWCVMVKSIPYPLLFNFIPISPTTHNFICYFFKFFCYLLVKVERTPAINFQWVLAVGNFWGRNRIEILCRTEEKLQSCLTQLWKNNTDIYRFSPRGLPHLIYLKEWWKYAGVIIKGHSWVIQKQGT